MIKQLPPISFYSHHVKVYRTSSCSHIFCSRLPIGANLICTSYQHVNPSQKKKYMKRETEIQLIIDIIKCGLIGLFCYTAVSKWLSYDDFMYQLKQSPFLHGGYTLFSFALPLAELSICTMLTVRSTAKAGFAAAALLLVLFTVYITCMLIYAPHIPCSCGGFLSGLSWRQHIVLNTVLAVLSMIGYLTEQGSNRGIALQKN